MSMATVALSELEVTTNPAVACAAVLRLLEELRGLVSQIPVTVYRSRPVPHVSGSIGEHVRHCLDHVDALTCNGLGDELSYDHRRRRTSVECDPAAALQHIDRLMHDVNGLADGELDHPLRVASLLERGGAADVAASTLRRELAFVFSHTTHHLALIALLLNTLGWKSPDGLGLAPSTPTRH